MSDHRHSTGTVPSVMRAVVLTDKGGPEVLTIAEVPVPMPGPEELLVAVRATALNRADLLQRMGFYPGPPMMHEIPGMEFAGTVVAVGERVVAHAIGDPVMGIVGGGADAEYLAVHERQAMAIPSSVDLGDAAAIPEVWITAFDAMVAQAGLTSGRTALVHAGASGVGTAAIQIAKAMGAFVIVTASAPKLDACRALGADLAIDYRSEDFVEAAMAFTGRHGVDVVLDVIGGDYLEKNLAAVAEKGTIIQVGVMGGGATEVDLGVVLRRRVRLIGTVLRSRPIEEKIAITRRFAAEVLPLFDAGLARPVIDSRFAFDDITEAHRHMEANANVGKILIDIDA
jgi:NADPH:quinone reductase